MTATKGIINAKPKDLSTNVPLAKVLEISDFLNAPENRVQIQFSSDKTKYGGFGGHPPYPRRNHK